MDKNLLGPLPQFSLDEQRERKWMRYRANLLLGFLVGTAFVLLAITALMGVASVH